MLEYHIRTAFMNHGGHNENIHLCTNDAQDWIVTYYSHRSLATYSYVSDDIHLPSKSRPTSPDTAGELRGLYKPEWP